MYLQLHQEKQDELRLLQDMDTEAFSIFRSGLSSAYRLKLNNYAKYLVMLPVAERNVA